MPFILLLVSLLFFSCTTAPPSITDKPPHISPDTTHPAAYTPPADAPPPEQPPETPFEAALALVKANQLPKRWSADGDNITLYADIQADGGTFTAAYDMAGATLQQTLRYSVPFVLYDDTSGESVRDTLLWRVEDDDSGILLSFDDDYTAAWERNFDLFDRYGARVTFFVQGKPVNFARRALDRGHDVGYHTRNHLNLPQVSRVLFNQETVSDLGVFRSAGVPLRSFAFPYGLSAPWMRDELLHSFSILRGYGVTFRIYSEDAVKGGYVAAKALDNLLYKSDAEFEAVITLMLRTVKFAGGVLPLCTHDIADSVDWGIKPNRLEFLLKTARDLRLKFYCYRDFF